MNNGRNYPDDFQAPAGSTFGGLAVDRKGRLKLSPENDLDANEKLVTDGDSFTITPGISAATATADVTAGVMTLTLPNGSLVLKDADTVEVNGYIYTFTISGGQIIDIAT